MKTYYQPIPVPRANLSSQGMVLAGGWMGFDQVIAHTRKDSCVLPVQEVPKDVLHQITQNRSIFPGLFDNRPSVMGILNVTPDSFSDGGLFHNPDDALSHANHLVDQGADVLDIGGESTRPGADFVPADQEISRVVPVIEALAGKVGRPISLDTRKSIVAAAGIKVGAAWINDVSALSYDRDMAKMVADEDSPVCLMHAQGDPKTMQAAPQYDNVLLDVYDYLEARIDFCVKAGINREKIIVDPGIGFGKSLDHNLALLKGLPLFHALGCPILLGVSRKRFIGTLAGVDDAKDRMPGSVSVAVLAAAAGVQIIRVHDVAETVQALKVAMPLIA